MKKLILSTACLFMAYGSKAQLCSHPAGTGVVKSYECLELNGKVRIPITLHFKDSVTIVAPPVVESPTGWTATPIPVTVAQDGFGRGDSLEEAIDVFYPQNELPFYPVSISIKQLVNLPQANLKNPSIDYFEITTKVLVYFTPYNTVEVWSIRDFVNQPRKWINPEKNPNAERKYVSRESIPQTNIDLSQTMEWDSTNWNDDWRDNFREVYVEGLAYAIPMKPVPPDSIEYYRSLGDGVADITSDVPEGAGAKTNKTYTGRVFGRLTAIIVNDLGQEQEIPLEGVQVTLFEYDPFFNDEFGKVYTDKDGKYEFNYSKSQSFEGGQIELFLRVKSKTDDKYQVHATDFWGWHYTSDYHEITVGEHFDDGVARDIRLVNTNWSFDQFTTIHWGQKAFRYFDEQGATLKPHLRMNIYFDVWFFDQNAFFNPVNFTPTLNLEDEDGDHESTIYHEFGHFAMYRLQDNNFDIPKGINSLDHYWGEENSSRLVWIEGWANAVEFILDANYYNEDKEFGYDRGDNAPSEEDRTHYLLSWTNYYTNPVIKNGVRSEYFIGCGIYDLWDGPNRGLPNGIPDGDNESGNEPHSYDDSGQGLYGWKTKDDVELSFYDICKPLITTKGTIKNFVQYNNNLVNNFKSNCKTVSDIRRTFEENRLLSNIEEHERSWNLLNISSSTIKLNYDFDDYGYNFKPWSFERWTDSYNLTLPNFDPITNFHHPYWNNRDVDNQYLTDNLWIGIDDQVNNIHRVTNLYFNDGTYYSKPVAYYQTCGITETLIRNGKIELGSNTTQAHLTIASGSALQVLGNGKLVVNNNSSVNIENGATFRLENNATIEFGGPNANLYAKDVIIANNATVYVKGSGIFWVSGNLNLPASSRIVVDNGARISMQQNGVFTFNAGSQIELNHPNSYLQFDGTSTLIVQTGATFTYTGSGYLIWGTTNPIDARSGSIFKLKGSDISDKILLVVNNRSLSHGSNLTRMIIQDGLVELGDQSFVECATIGMFNRVDFTNTSGTYQQHKGLRLSGASNKTIINSIFEYGQYGLQLNGTGKFGPYVIRNCQILENTTGIYSNSTGVGLDNTEIAYNDIGWKAEVVTIPSSVSNCNIHDNYDQGIRYASNSSCPLTVEDCQVKDNEIGIDSYGFTVATVACSSFEENTTGIKINPNGLLDASSFSRLGNNTFTKWNTPGSSIQFISAYSPYITLGLNNFNRNSSSKHLYGTLYDMNAIRFDPFSKALYTLAAIRVDGPMVYPGVYDEMNTYCKSTSWVSNCDTPVFGTDYEMYYATPIETTIPVSSPYLNNALKANPPKAYLKRLTYTPTSYSCTTPPPCSDDEFPSTSHLGSVPCASTALSTCLTCDVIITSSFKGIPINRAAWQSQHSLNTSENETDSAKAIGQLREVVTANLVQPDNGDIKSVRIAYQTLAQAIGNQVRTSPTLSNQLKANINAGIAAVDYLLSKQNKYLITDPLLLSIDKASFYNMLGDVNGSLGIVRAGKTAYPNSNQIAYANYWECSLDLSAKLLAGSISIADYWEQVNSCTFPDIKPWKVTSPPQNQAKPENIEIEASNGIEIYPNPVNLNGTKTTVVVKLDKEQDVTMAVYDGLGRLVKQVNQNVHANEGYNQYAFDNSELSNGLYWVVVSGNELKLQQRLSVIK